MTLHWSLDMGLLVNGIMIAIVVIYWIRMA